MKQSIIQDLLFIIISGVLLYLLVIKLGAETVGAFSFILVYGAYLFGGYFKISSKRTKK